MQSNILQHDHDDLGELLHDLKLRLGQNDLDQSFQLLDLFWAKLAIHIRAENLVLFPAILNAVSSHKGEPTSEEARAAVAVLRADHNFFMVELAEAIKIFREVQAGSKSKDHLVEILARVNAVAERLESHNALEEGKVYHWPARMLDPTDQGVVDANIKKQLQNIPPRFE
jgi:hypothetical protein